MQQGHQGQEAVKVAHPPWARWPGRWRRRTEALSRAAVVELAWVRMHGFQSIKHELQSGSCIIADLA